MTNPTGGPYQILFRGGPIDGMNVPWASEFLPDQLKCFLTNSPDEVEIPPVGECYIYVKQDLFVSDMAPKIKAIIYVWQKK